MENALQTIQSVEWTDSVGIELVLSEINSLEDVLKKAKKEIESESRAIYALKDRFEDDLMGKISVLNTYGIRVNDESML
jgi:TATA-binding protein-associated factor Taf7